MDYLIKLIILLTTTCANKCFESFQITNQTLYDGIVDHFFPKEFRNTKFDIKNYLYFLKNHTCSRCTRNCRYYGTCCIDVFFNNNVRSVEDYVDIFFNLTTIRKHVETLPVINIEDNSIDFRVEKLPIVASCENKQSVYADLCSRYRSSVDVRVIADGFVYKNKYCALCHGFRIYTNAPLQLTSYNTFTEASSTKLTIPNGLFELSTRTENGLGYEKEQQIEILSFLSRMKKLTCSTQDINLCHHSYLALIRTKKNWYANPYCAKCNGETDLKHSVCPDDMYILHPYRLTHRMDVNRPKPLFRLLISFDDHGKSDSVLVKGNPICSGDQHFDVYSNQCKSKSRDLFSLKHHFLNNKVCSHPETLSQKFEVTKDCNVSVNNTIYNITDDIILD